MPEQPDSGGAISEDELKRLTDLFIQFEGASDPRSIECREAEAEFDSLLDLLYREKVEPKFKSLDRLLFRSHTRRLCRTRADHLIQKFHCP